jgi:Ser/Thr protein kinase RdoA (MazF antagonist)
MTAVIDVTGELREGYGLSAMVVERVHAGVATANFRAVTDHGDVFVKVYPAGTDVAAEVRALKLGATARDGGVPVPRVRPSRDGDPVWRAGAVSMSVHEWCPGRTRVQLTPAAGRSAGRTLGLIHRRFAALPESHQPSARAARFRRYDHTAHRRRFTALLDRARSLAGDDAFAARAVPLLERRLTLLDRVPVFLEGLGELPTQVGHGDSSTLNFLFSGTDDVIGVVDFRPPLPYFRDFELARIAFDPETIAERTDWAEIAGEACRAYLDANPAARVATTARAPWLWLCHLLRSDYGVKQHLTDPHPTQQDGLDRYWEARCAAADAMLDAAPALEATLIALVGDRS